MYCILYRHRQDNQILVHVQYEFVRQHFLTMNHSDDPQTLSLINLQCRLTQRKGSVSQDFLLLVFFMYQFPHSPRVFH
jgi:hypothetical protein